MFKSIRKVFTSFIRWFISQSGIKQSGAKNARPVIAERKRGQTDAERRYKKSQRNMVWRANTIKRYQRTYAVTIGLVMDEFKANHGIDSISDIATNDEAVTDLYKQLEEIWRFHKQQVRILTMGKTSASKTPFKGKLI
tara:strand:- start:541 stop:954 length:414 start_codon:yes stop_codon:yes gene_type:complete